MGRKPLSRTERRAGLLFTDAGPCWSTGSATVFARPTPGCRQLRTFSSPRHALLSRFPPAHGAAFVSVLAVEPYALDHVHAAAGDTPFCRPAGGRTAAVLASPRCPNGPRFEMRTLTSSRTVEGLNKRFREHTNLLFVKPDASVGY